MATTSGTDGHMETIDDVADAIAAVLDIDAEKIGINRVVAGRRNVDEIVLSNALARRLVVLARKGSQA